MKFKTILTEHECRTLDSALLSSIEQADKVAKDERFTDTVRHTAEVKRDEVRRVRQKLLDAVRDYVPS